MARRSDETLQKLPELKSLDVDKSKALKLKKLMARAIELSASARELKEVRSQITELGQDIGQFRIGDMCAIVSFTDGRRTLSKELLIENGVTPLQLAKSTKVSDGNWKLELQVIGANDGDPD